MKNERNGIDTNRVVRPWRKVEESEAWHGSSVIRNYSSNTWELTIEAV